MYVPFRKRERMLRSSVTWRQDSELKFDQTYTNKLVSDSLKNSRMRHYSYSTKDLSLQNTHVQAIFHENATCVNLFWKDSIDAHIFISYCFLDSVIAMNLLKISL